MDGEVLLAAYITAAYMERGDTPEVNIRILCYDFAWILKSLVESLRQEIEHLGETCEQSNWPGDDELTTSQEEASTTPYGGLCWQGRIWG